MSLVDKIGRGRISLPKMIGKPDPTILLCPNVPKPMHGVAPRVVLGAVWWNKTRKEAYESTNFFCRACGVHKLQAKYHQWLEGHEFYRINYRKGLMTYVRTDPLCHFCHCYIHSGRLKSLLEKGEIRQAKYAAIIQHGDAILRAAKLKKPEPPEFVAEWSTWRLVLYGKKYPPVYKSFEEWKGAHGY